MKIKLPIVLIGPMAAGKSTVGAEVARLTRIPQIPMDRVRWYYYFANGYRLETENELPTLKEKLKYWKPFEVNAVERILSEFPEAVIDFGAGHSHYTDQKHFDFVSQLLAPLPNIFLILPSKDKAASVRICNERLTKRLGHTPDSPEVNQSFIEDSSNYRLAKHIVYNDGEEPAATAERIVALLS